MKKTVFVAMLMAFVFIGCGDKGNNILVEHEALQDKNKVEFMQYSKQTTQVIFKEFPRANSVLFGDIYFNEVNDVKTVTIFFRPTSIVFKKKDYINNSGIDKIKKETKFEELYTLTAKLNNGDIKNLNIEKYERDKPIQDFILNCKALPFKTLVYLVVPYFDYLFDFTDVKGALAKIGTLITPSFIENREAYKNLIKIG